MKYEFNSVSQICYKVVNLTHKHVRVTKVHFHFIDSVNQDQSAQKCALWSLIYSF